MGISGPTTLGQEMGWDLLLVFLGVWDEWEMPEIPARHGSISRERMIQLWEISDFEERAESILRPIVQDAFSRATGCPWSMQ